MLRHRDSMEPRPQPPVRQFYPNPHQCLREDRIPNRARDGVLVRLQLGRLWTFPEYCVQGQEFYPEELLLLCRQDQRAKDSRCNRDQELPEKNKRKWMR